MDIHAHVSRPYLHAMLISVDFLEIRVWIRYEFKGKKVQNHVINSPCCLVPRIFSQAQNLPHFFVTS